MAKFASIYHCRRCGHKWRVITKSAPEIDEPSPACPNLACCEVQTPIGMDLSLQKAPAAIGGNIQHKAIDETAKIVMEDHGLTDLRDDVRQSETMSPKLHPRLQAQADAYFGGGANRQRRMGFNPGMHAARAMAGALHDPVAEERSITTTHRQQIRAPTHVVADDRLLRR